jgi:hypothetical protein
MLDAALLGLAIDEVLIQRHLEILHWLASPLAGQAKLVITAFGEDPDSPNPTTGEPGCPLAPSISHLRIGNVEASARTIIALTSRRHSNAYAPLAAFRGDLPSGSKGAEKDIVAVLGLVADFDDAAAARWAERLPIAPNYVLETSAGRFQAFYLFDKPEPFEAVKSIAQRLKTFAGCDHGTADLSHVWRIAGTLNWPNSKKVTAGRPRQPQLVRVAQPWGGDTVALADLAAALPELADQPKAGKPKADTSRPMDGANIDQRPAADQAGTDAEQAWVNGRLALLPEWLVEKIRTSHARGTRSKAMYAVIAGLIDSGKDDATIARIIRAHPAGIGAKYVGRNDLDKEIERVRSYPAKQAANGGYVRPVVQVMGGALRGIIDEAERQLVGVDTGIFQRGDVIVRPAQTPIPIAENREAIGLRLVPVKVNHLVERLTDVVDFRRFDARSKAWVSIDCPQKIAATYLERIGAWHLRVLTGITNAPTLRPDGTIIDRPGYDDATGVLYDPLGVIFPDVTAAPTKNDALAALTVLKGLIATFDFVDDASRSVSLSGFLTSVSRYALATAPMHAFRAPVAGSGKSMLVDAAAMIASGHEAPVISPGKSEEETEKRLGAAMIAGHRIISFDNVEYPLGGVLLCQALTQPAVSIRVLGKSELIVVPNTATFFATGNNLSVVGDMSRRTIIGSLDPGCEQPELRKFETGDPISLIRRDRPRYVAAVLTILRAFHLAGRPQSKDPLGSFADWSGLVRGALVWLGAADPCETMANARAEDPKFKELSNVIHQWDLALQGEIVTAKELIDHALVDDPQSSLDQYRRAYRHPELREALLVVAGDGGSINSRRLGNWLSSVKGRIVDGRRIAPETMLNGISRWKLCAGS